MVTAISLAAGLGVTGGFAGVEGVDLLQNSRFDFHSFVPHREGRAISHTSHSVAFWNTERWGDIKVQREAVAPVDIRPEYSAGNLVTINPGKRFYQFFTLPEAELAHGDKISLVAGGYQDEKDALVASIRVMKLDSEDGTWVPSEYGVGDPREFPRLARGELVVHKTYQASSSDEGRITLRVNDALIEGNFVDSRESSSAHINTIGIEVEFKNEGKKPVWVWTPSLVKGSEAEMGLPEARPMVAWYTHIPRTIQKLWKGEAIHVLVMGSSIDRGSAGPPLMVYDEDPESPTFKQPITQSTGARIEFDAELVGRPDLKKYTGWTQHHFSYAGRLRQELMRKFDVGPDKILLNFMARDSGSVGESVSALEEYCSLAHPPHAFHNGGSRFALSWQDIHPELFERPEGPGPDLVVFGHGANRKTDTPHEVAVFEGVIRWIQNRYPHSEFLFSLFQNRGEYSPNQGDLQALSLRYSIPMLDYGKPGTDIARWCNRYTLTPPNGHPAESGHYLWFKQIEKAFQCWDPILPGQPQQSLPERAHRNTYGWEGAPAVFKGEDPRISTNLFVFEDTALNAWITFNTLDAFVDSKPLRSRVISASRPHKETDLRISAVSFGDAKFGDRHILEIPNDGSSFNSVDSYVCPNRTFISVDSAIWEKPRRNRVSGFSSLVGAPYGSKQVVLQPGAALRVHAVGTDLSIAYADTEKGGRLKVLVNGEQRLKVRADKPYKTADERELYLENRKGITGLGYGWHDVVLEAVDAPVPVLGMFVYDRRPNMQGERRIRGYAAGGDEIRFSPMFETRPVVLCYGDLKCSIDDVTESTVKFSGGSGAYEIIGGGARTRPVLEVDWKALDEEELEDLPETAWIEVFSDEFDREELGANYKTVSGDWKIADGKLTTGSTEHSAVLYIKGRYFTGDFRISMDCTTLESFADNGACDMSFFSDMSDSEKLDAKNGYFWFFGSRQNTVTGLRREGTALVLEDEPLIVPGETHKMVLERVEDVLMMTIDGKPVFQGRDMHPPETPENATGVLYVMKSLVEFDNIKIEKPE